jgi:LysM repeat protein
MLTRIKKEIYMLRKTFISIRPLFLLIVLLLPSSITAQTQEYKDYTIQKGDTLWDISQRELTDSFLWPKIWKENPEIKNPDRIYPKQKIRIPLYLLQKEIPETKPKAEAEIKPEIIKEKPVEKLIVPVKKEYLVNKNTLIASGYIADSIPNVGKIIDSPIYMKDLLAKGDYAYIKTDNPTTIGEKFYIIRSVEKVKHPESGRKLGYLIEIIGVAEVVENDNDTKIIITDSYDEIQIGSLLDNFYDIEPPLEIETPRRPVISGYVVATRQLHVINGKWDIVYIDKGRKVGLEVGDLIATTLQSKHKIINGLIQIIRLGDSTSTAIVRKCNQEIIKGDGITRATQG